MLGILICFLSAPLMLDYLPAGSRQAIFFLDTEGIRGPFLWCLYKVQRLGVDMQTCCKIYRFVCNLAMCLTAFGSFRAVCGDNTAAFAGTVCYSFSVYAVYVSLVRGSLGESTALIFLPLVACSLYRIYTSGAEEKKWIRLAVWLGCGLLGIFYSHIPLAMVVLGFLFLTMLLLWRRTLCKQRLFILVTSLTGAFLGSLVIWVRYLREMLNGDQYAVLGGKLSFSLRAPSLAQLLVGFYGNTGNTEGMLEGELIGLGLPLSIIAVVWVFMRFLKGKDFNNSVTGRAMFLIGLSVLALIMSSALFPWGAIQRLHWLPRVLLEHVGYPYRFLAVSVVLLSLCVSLFGQWIKERFPEKRILFLVVVIVLNVFGGMYLANDQLYTVMPDYEPQADVLYEGLDFVYYISE